MAQSWTYDSDTGCHKNHELSSKIYEAAFEMTEFASFVTPVDGGFGKGKGESVDLMTISGPAEPGSAVLTEGVRIPEDRVTLSSNRITVVEFGRAITHTNLFDILSKYDMSNLIQKRLREQMRLSLDTAAAEKFKSFKVKYIPTGVGSAVFDTDGVASTTASANINLFHLQRIRDYLYGTLKAPFFDGKNYIGIANFQGLRGVKDDPNWQQWKLYNNPEVLMSGEIGTIESIRLIETNHSEALGTSGSASVLGEAVIFGDESVALVEAQTPELRIRPGDDYGRSLGVAWYGILQYGLFHDTANPREARGVHVTSA